MRSSEFSGCFLMADFSGSNGSKASFLVTSFLLISAF